MDTSIASKNAGKNIMAFRFAVRQKVTIDAIDTKGLIIAIGVDSEGISYKVAYFDDDKVRRIEWMDETELSA